MSFRRRTYPEVLDSMLTSLVGGEGAESHPFPPGASPPFRHNLRRSPVADIVSVYGSLNGQAHLFRRDADYTLEGGKTLQWKPQGGDLPDEGTLVSVNYTLKGGSAVVTDIQTGSVVRTLTESVALEVAALYAQLGGVYDSAFIDTATGGSLDKVVALLGIERVQGGKAVGQVEFTRAPGSRGVITIPAGTRVITEDGKIAYETLDEVTLNSEQNSVRVSARDFEDNDVLPAGSLKVLPVPIAGIASATNVAPTAILTQTETDPQLRTRAKSFLHGSERATIGALVQAFAQQGVPVDVNESTPGVVDVTPHAEITPELLQRLERAKEAVRPAGVVVRILGGEPPRPVNLKLRLTSAPGLVERDLRAAQRSVKEKVQEFFAQLPLRANASVNRIVGLVLAVPEIIDVKIVSATWNAGGVEQDVLSPDKSQLNLSGAATALGELQIIDSALATRITVVVSFPSAEAPADRVGIEAAMSAAVNYLNETNAAELPSTAPAGERARRVLSYRKLLNTIPLPPARPGVPLRSFDDLVAGGASPALPTEPDVAPYQVQFTIAQQSGAARILAGAADPDYTLEPFERLALAAVEASPR